MNYKAETVAAIFDRIADLMEITDTEPYKARVYRKGARNVRKAADRLEQLHEDDQLESISGIGPALAEKIAEILETGQCQYLDILSEEVPLSILELLRIDGMGTKTVRSIYQQIGIESLEELEEAAREKRLRKLKGIGPRTEQRILSDIMKQKTAVKTYTLDWADAVAEQLVEILNVHSGIVEVWATGQLRRRCELIECVTLLVVTEDLASIDPQKCLTSCTNSEKISCRHENVYKSCEFKMEEGTRCRLYFVESDLAAAVSVALTGTMKHLQSLRKLGFELDIDGKTERKIYERLGLQYIPPELREGMGEIESAKSSNLPSLVSLPDLRGDLHCHSHWSDGSVSIEQMIKGAIDRKLDYLAITDHSRSLSIAGGLDVDELRKQGEEIVELREKYPDFDILHGIEVDILHDGTLDLPDDILNDLDIVIASLHQGLRKSSDSLTNRLIRAAEHPAVNILGHPTARLLGVRDTDTPDLDRVLRACAENSTAVEINAHPDRLDLPWRWARRAREVGVKIVINSDAHSTGDFDLLQYGIDTARKGWCCPEDIANTKSIDDLLAYSGSSVEQRGGTRL